VSGSAEEEVGAHHRTAEHRLKRSGNGSGHTRDADDPIATLMTADMKSRGTSNSRAVGRADHQGRFSGERHYRSAVLQQPLDGGAGEFGGVAGGEFAFDVFAVRVDGVCAEAEPVGDPARG
jgi:hypothetical protein